VNYSKHIKGDYVKTYSGWVNINFVEAPNFKSQILYPIFPCAKDNEISKKICDYSGCSSWIESVEGTIIFIPGVLRTDGFYVNLKGNLVNLSFYKEKIGYVLYNKKNDIRIEVYTIPSANSYES